jgi:hypothetical protein
MLGKNGESICNDLCGIGKKVTWEQFAQSTQTRREWTEWEDRLPLQLRQRSGAKWILIAEKFPPGSSIRSRTTRRPFSRSDWPFSGEYRRLHGDGARSGEQHRCSSAIDREDARNDGTEKEFSFWISGASKRDSIAKVETKFVHSNLIFSAQRYDLL